MDIARTADVLRRPENLDREWDRFVAGHDDLQTALARATDPIAVRSVSLAQNTFRAGYLMCLDTLLKQGIREEQP